MANFAGWIRDTSGVTFDKVKEVKEREPGKTGGGCARREWTEELLTLPVLPLLSMLLSRHV